MRRRAWPTAHAAFRCQACQMWIDPGERFALVLDARVVCRLCRTCSDAGYDRRFT